MHENIVAKNQYDEASVLSGVAVVRDLPPLHRRYAVRRGMAALGLRGAPPPIDDLMVAAVPPSPPRMEPRRFLSGESLYRWAVDHLFGDPRFDGIDGYFDFPRAMAAASMAVGPGAQARHQREHEDAVKRYHHEKAIFDQWHGLARWLAAFVNDITEWTSDSSLAAMPDGDLQRIAAQMVSKNQADIGATRRANRAAGHPLPDLTPLERRSMCPQWWRRQLRRRAAAARQMWSAALRTTGGRHAAAYVDAYSMARWTERQDQARIFGESHVMVGDDGTTIPMRDVMDASATGALSRACAMLLGVDEIATRKGMASIFITITLPAEYHPNPARGACSWRPEYGPKKADAALAAIWRRFRARLQKKGIMILGMRVIEGHADGTPHLHAILYVDPLHIAMVDRILQEIRPEPVSGARVATTLVVIDRARGRATTYIMKALLGAFNVAPTRAIRDRRVDADARTEIGHLLGIRGSALTDQDDDDFGRHRALASERGWRRFQMLGVHGIQRVWQAIFTMKSIPDGAPQRIRECHRAMRERRWGDAILALGALRHDNGGRVRLGYGQRESRYGEMRTVPAHILDESSGWTMPIRRQEWKIQRRPKEIAENQNTKAIIINSMIPYVEGDQKFQRNLSECRDSNVDISGVTVAYSDPRDGSFYYKNSGKYFRNWQIDINIAAQARHFRPREALRDP